MGFVGNYAPCGLSPQMYDMPVILNRALCRNSTNAFLHPDGEGAVRMVQMVGA